MEFTLQSSERAVDSLPVPTALPADSFFPRILLRLSEAKGSTCTMSKGESTWTVSTTWLMVSMILLILGGAGEEAEAIDLTDSLVEQN